MSTPINIQSIIHSAGQNKTFHKFLTMCIHLGVSLFFRGNGEEEWKIKTVNDIKGDLKRKRIDTCQKLKDGVTALSCDDKFQDAYDGLHTIYKKNVEEIETVEFILNMFTDQQLKDFCSYSKIKQDPTTSDSSPNITDRFIDFYSNT